MTTLEILPATDDIDHTDGPDCICGLTVIRHHSHHIPPHAQGAAMSNETPNIGNLDDIIMGMRQLREMWEAAVNAGFTEDQAMELIIAMVKGN